MSFYIALLTILDKQKTVAENPGITLEEKLTMSPRRLKIILHLDTGIGKNQLRLGIIQKMMAP